MQTSKGLTKLKNALYGAKNKKIDADGFSVYFHPLFFVFGFFYAIKGEFFIFLIYTLSAVLHEVGHSVAASRRGYKLKKLSLTPFGASISGDFDLLPALDEFFIAISGPLTSFFIAVIIVASWWLVPNLYPYTEVIFYANMTLAIINLLPVTPLDGGRILSAILNLSFKKRVGELTLKILGVVVSFALFVVFIALFYVKGVINISILFFATFIFIGGVSKKSQNVYIRAYFGLGQTALKRGVRVNAFAISSCSMVRTLLNKCDATCFNIVLIIYPDGKSITLTEDDIVALINNASLTDNLDCAVKYVKQDGKIK